MFHRKYHDDSIKRDVDSGCDPTLEMYVITSAFVEPIPLIPGKINGPALDSSCEEKRDRIGCTYTHNAVREDPEALGGKDAEIEEENGDLGDTEGDHVEDLSHVVVLQDVGDLDVGQCPYISSKSILFH